MFSDSGTYCRKSIGKSEEGESVLKGKQCSSVEHDFLQKEGEWPGCISGKYRGWLHHLRMLEDLRGRKPRTKQKESTSTTCRAGILVS